jgi:DNA repair protein RadC
MIMAHNHPSGALVPSQADVDLTRKMTQAGKYLDIGVVDHVIMTSESYYSFADEGLIP